MTNTPEQITRNMRANKPKDTKPELLLRKELWSRGLRYRKNCRKVFGNPDIVFMRAKVAVFADGRLWHGYDWENSKNNFKTNRDYWISKIERNMERDREVDERLTSEGWIVLRFWDFEIMENVSLCADKVGQALGERARGAANRKKRTEIVVDVS